MKTNDRILLDLQNLLNQIYKIYWIFYLTLNSIIFRFLIEVYLVNCIILKDIQNRRSSRNDILIHFYVY